MENTNKKSKFNNVDEAKKFYDDDFSKLPVEIQLKILTSFVDFGLKDVALLCKASKQFKKEFCDTGIIYDEIFRRQFGIEKLKYVQNLCKPVEISALNKLFAYRSLNVCYSHIDEYDFIYYPHINLQNLKRVRIGIEIYFLHISIDVTEFNDNEIHELTKILNLNQSKIIKFVKIVQKDSKTWLTYDLKSRPDMYDAMFIIYANIFQLFGFKFYYSNEVFFGCNYCGAQNNLKTCGNCFTAKYCDIECQASDYNKHKKDCK